jgi:hypothetical protein
MSVLSQRSIETLLDLVEIKLSCCDRSGRRQTALSRLPPDPWPMPARARRSRRLKINRFFTFNVSLTSGAINY